MRPLLILGTMVLSATLASSAFAQAPTPQPHNIVLFVADGLRRAHYITNERVETAIPDLQHELGHDRGHDIQFVRRRPQRRPA